MSEEVLTRASELFSSLFGELERVIVGQREALEHMVITILCNGHALVESNPGLGKTLTISTLARLMELKFSRIQCTPDLMPSDITGTYILEEEDGRKQFRFEKGPVFANIVLADEINRASPKTQSALLEAMQERHVTVGRETFPLERPFFVLATQNPIEMEGTFPLPEAQLDRFLLKIQMDYPSPEEEMAIIDRYTTNVVPDVKRVMGREELLMLQRLTRDVPISNELKQRVVKIITATRRSIPEIAYGASPRASIGLILAAKARAFIHGRSFVSREDVDAMAYPVLRHRIILTFEAERKGLTSDMVISNILKSV
ncbi:AAA family ATPase [Methermicoccus shengliensis]|uniref:MoxR family ATPase n=1 Tax=Methermicoccus shengliensis TaxID=660064 RepID=A0A832RX48_9EURY|nr:MoxR family ATPase [Methermicoccus shengliensis]KUK04526.1 MAG: ATPase associated with various cellular activities AAA_3 [Euryarchaeota archaeon 55_53]KUK30610.1 MAG: ATPase associated with various cellular activities AAA_3 [Methanosarcinales archeaon 56_1174]MDI3488159.1 MoxR-like ATPase [Methanosarcinales archaeon]MDN5295434.1 MoxR-like ATPase [Methanosarcinales archaeon]HIH70200.1 MoxR family ATPase [Methermicoccus shengliensis]